MDQLTITAYNESVAQIAALHDILVPERIYQLVDRFFVKGAASADVGCGIGRDTCWLSQHGYPVTGIDAAEMMLLEARKRYPGLRFVQDSMPLLTTMGDGVFTNVLCSAVVMHVKADQTALAIVHLLRIMTVGGVIVISFRGTKNVDHRENGKLYNPIIANELIDTFVAFGAMMLHCEKTHESGRSLEWQNLVFRKLPHPAV